MGKVYVELMMLDNGMMNFLILYLTGKLTHQKIKKTRILWAALSGAIYALGVFVFGIGFLNTMPVKIGVSFLMYAIAFGSGGSGRKLCAGMAGLYAITFLCGGILIGAYFLSGKDPLWEGFLTINSAEMRCVLLFFITLIAFKSIFTKYFNRLIKEKKFYYQVELTIGGKTAQIDAFLDSGNNLKDPISKKPVIVVEYHILEDILPNDLKMALQYVKDNALDFDTAVLISERKHMVLIPFTTIGEQSSFLLGIKPEQVAIVRQNEREYVDAIIGITFQKLSGKGEFCALLAPDFYL